MSSSDDERLARALRELRRRKCQTQADAAKEAGVSRPVCAHFDARAFLNVTWKGAALDRMGGFGRRVTPNQDR